MERLILQSAIFLASKTRSRILQRLVKSSGSLQSIADNTASSPDHAACTCVLKLRTPRPRLRLRLRQEMNLVVDVMHCIVALIVRVPRHLREKHLWLQVDILHRAFREKTFSSQRVPGRLPSPLLRRRAWPLRSCRSAWLRPSGA